MRKWLFILIFIGLLFVVGCGDGSEGNSKTGDQKRDEASISIWHNYAGDDLRAQVVREMIEEFKEDHPDIKVDAQAIPVDGYRERISTVAAAKELPDVFLTYPGSFTDEFYKGELIQPIDSLFDDHSEWKEGFLESALDPYVYGDDNNIYSVPVAMSATSFLFYNKSLFEDNDLAVPETWEELLDVIDAFNALGITPIALGNKEPWVAQSTTFGALADRVTGTDWFLKAVDQEGASFTDPEFTEALGYFKELVDKEAYQEGANALDNTQAEQYFAQKNAAMIVNGSWTISSLAASMSKEELEDIGVTVFPDIAGGSGKGNTITGGPGGGFLLNSKTEGDSKDAALDLIYALSSAEAQKRVAESESMVMYDVDIQEGEVSSLFYDTFNLLRRVEFSPVYDIHLSSSAGEAVNNGLQEIMLGGDLEKVAESVQNSQATASE